MDQLQAMRYFVAAAQGRSFSAAARQLDVSVPAVAKLVAALEKTLGAQLFERTSRGLSLTSQGAAYLDDCHNALSLIDQADERLASSQLVNMLDDCESVRRQFLRVDSARSRGLPAEEHSSRLGRVAGTPDELANQIRDDTTRWRRIVRSTGVHLD
jgi:molybdenum-dependent DNA-binding transcriptional regulator ModE